MPRPNENSNGMNLRPSARRPSAPESASHSAATTMKPIAELSGALGMRVRRRLGGSSYGRSFLGFTLGFTVIGRVDPRVLGDRSAEPAAALYRTATPP